MNLLRTKIDKFEKLSTGKKYLKENAISNQKYLLRNVGYKGLRVKKIKWNTKEIMNKNKTFLHNFDAPRAGLG